MDVLKYVFHLVHHQCIRTELGGALQGTRQMAIVPPIDEAGGMCQGLLDCSRNQAPCVTDITTNTFRYHVGICETMSKAKASTWQDKTEHREERWDENIV